GQAGVVSSIVKPTSPPSIWTSLTKPSVTMSLWRSGSCTPRSAPSTSSLVTLTSVSFSGEASGRDRGLVDDFLQRLELRGRAAEHLALDLAGAVDHERRRVALRHAEGVAGLLV